MNLQQYAFPVSQIITLGNIYLDKDESSPSKSWNIYTHFGFTNEHIPDLIEVLNDESLYDAEGNESYACIHAWRILAELKAHEAVPHFITTLSKIDDANDDWISAELPIVFSKIGPDAIGVLVQYIEIDSDKIYAKSCACAGIAKIGVNYSEQRCICVEALSRLLSRFEKNHDFVNACIIGSLLDLKAVETIDIIREAFTRDCVDLDMQGDIEDVEIELGIRTARSSTRKISETHQRLRTLLDFAEISTQIVRTEPKVGRNDPCICGSGKKFKKCCLSS